MMSVRGKILWAASAVLLVFLYLASSTDLIIKEKVREIHTVSIVLDDVNDTYYQNFKKGVDQAARDYYADTSYITLYEEVSQEEQTKLVDREVGDGADAVVVIPVDAEAFQGAIQGKWPETPLVVLGAGEDHPGVNARIYVDNFQAGRLLAEKALEEVPEGTRFWLLSALGEEGRTDQVLEGVLDVLGSQGAEYEEKREWQFSGENREEAAAQFAATADQLPGAAVIALDRESLMGLAEYLKSDASCREQLSGVYGLGSTTSLLNSLDAGVIDGLVTYDQYTAGYLCVERAIEAIRDGDVKKPVRMNHYYITKENMRDKKYEAMLYPMD